MLYGALNLKLVVVALKKFLAASFLVLLVQSHVWATPPALKQVTLDLFWKHQFEFAGFYIAKEKKFYEQAGIDVSFTEYDGKTSYLNRLESEKSQFSTAGIYAIKDYHEGHDLKLVASYFKRSPLAILTNTNIQSLSDLEGKTIISNNNLLNTGSLKEMLDFHRIDPSTIKSIESVSPVSLLEQKKADGMVVFVSDQPFYFTKRKIPFRIFSPGQFGVQSHDLNLITTSKFVRQHPTLVRNFVKASTQGWKYALENQEETVDLILRKYNSQNKSKEALLFEAKETSKFIMPNSYELGSINRDHLDNISEKLLLDQKIQEIRPIKGLLLAETGATADKELLKKLTKEERNFVNDNPILRIPENSEYPPFELIGPNGPEGYSIDLLAIMVDKLGMTLDYVEGTSWNDYLNKFKNSEVDVLATMVDLEARRSFASFSPPYAQISIKAIIRNGENENYSTKARLKGSRIAIVQDFAINTQLQSQLPGHTYKTYQSVSEAMHAVSSGEADVYFDGNVLADYYLKKHMMVDLVVRPLPESLTLEPLELSYAVKNTNPLLLSILNKSYASISESTLIGLRNKWLATNVHKKTDSLSDDELAYIDKNPEVTLCRLGFNPSSTAENLVNFFIKDTNFRLKSTKPMSWQSALSSLTNGDCDMLLKATPTEERKKEMLFTPAYARSPTIILTQNQIPDFEHITQFKDEDFVVIKGHSLLPILRSEYPDIRFHEVDEVLQAIQLIADGKYFGFIATQDSLKIIEGNSLSNAIKTSNRLDRQFDDIQSIAFSKNNEILHQVFSKLIKRSSREELVSFFSTSSQLTQNQITFSEEERQFIASETVTLCNDTSTSLSEFVDFIRQKTGLSIRHGKNRDWNTLIPTLETRGCDFIVSITASDSRKDRFGFTPSYHQENRVFAVSQKNLVIRDISDHLDQQFAVERGDSIVEALKRDYPQIKLREVDNIPTGLKLVTGEEVFAFIGNLSDVANNSRKYELASVKIAGTLPEKYDDHWSIATRKEDLLLLSILSKLVTHTDRKEFRRILFGDFALKYEQGFDYALMWKIALIGLIVLSAFIVWNRRLASFNIKLAKANRAAKEARNKVKHLLNSSSEGYLSFEKDLKIEPEYSAACFNLLNTENISGKNVSELLFKEEPSKKLTFDKGVSLLFGNTNELKQSLLLSLLPESLTLGQKSLEVKYSYDKERVVVKLTDVTEPQRLQLALNTERAQHQKIINAITNKDDLLSILADFKDINLNVWQSDKNPELFDDDIKALFRQLHTAKGLFAQIHFVSVTDELHQIETDLSDYLNKRTAKAKETLKQKLMLSQVFEKLNEEKCFIEDYLGNDYFYSGSEIRINQDQLNTIIKTFESYLPNESATKALSILKECQKSSIKEWLRKHAISAKEQAMRVKNVAVNVSLVGDDIRIPAHDYGPFLQSLIHVYRNSVTHGFYENQIENAYIRTSISLEDALIIIKIGDNGQGIDSKALRQRILENGLIPKEKLESLDDQLLLRSIFDFGISTNMEISTDSGRGVGLAEVKYQLEQIGGQFDLHSTYGKGTQFTFSIPLKLKEKSHQHSA